MIRLFEIENQTVKPTEHCYTIKWLKAVMDRFPEPEIHINAYAYIFYMTCPGQDNPFHNVRMDIRAENISADVNLNFDTEDDVIIEALKKATELFETPTVRAHTAVSTMLDNMIDYMTTAKITSGKDGNLPALIKLATDFKDIRQSHKDIVKDLEAEQQTIVWGKQELAYDQSLK
jgi:hypothetical protein